MKAPNPGSAVYDLAVGHALPLIVEVRVPPADYARQSSYWGYHAVRDIGVLLVAVPDCDRLSILLRLADRATAEKQWRLKVLLPRAEIVRRLHGQLARLAPFDEAAFQPEQDRLCLSLGTLARRVGAGTCGLNTLLVALSHVQNPRQNQTAAFIAAAEASVAGDTG